MINYVILLAEMKPIEQIEEIDFPYTTKNRTKIFSLNYLSSKLLVARNGFEPSTHWV